MAKTLREEMMEPENLKPTSHNGIDYLVGHYSILTPEGEKVEDRVSDLNGL